MELRVLEKFHYYLEARTSKNKIKIQIYEVVGPWTKLFNITMIMSMLLLGKIC